MAFRILKIERPSSAPSDPDEYYRCLTNRNFHFVSPKAQEAIRNLKVLVAGCGAGGGACAEPLARLGIQHLRLADMGAYELSNFNRQRAYIENIGENKAEYNMRAVKRINPHADVKAYTEGLTSTNLHELVTWADVIFDCVDVTAKESVRMKVKLHGATHAQRKPLFAPMDLGFCQTGMGFDYRSGKLKPLNGKVDETLACENPIKALLMFFPLSRFPGYTIKLVEDAVLKKPLPVSQVGCASDLLSSVACASIVRYAESGEVVRDWHVDFGNFAQPFWRMVYHHLSAPIRRSRLRARLRGIA